MSWYRWLFGDPTARNEQRSPESLEEQIARVKREDEARAALILNARRRPVIRRTQSERRRSVRRMKGAKT